ncbi:hypothetical protein F5Y08DRAFT_348811 [Xylaria arbuscula]|nr:hypothetical protein F5Y08DRAFT_348811 [Xylaria arbuscula]
METPPNSDHPKRVNKWAITKHTYHSLYGQDDDKEKLINPENYEDLDAPKEEPKVALRSKFSWFHPLVHFLPVVATLSIVQLSFRGVYWEDASRYDTRWQTVLQFPAKLHEILVVGSLSAIVLHIFRRMLVSEKGIPLGLMVGAFQMGSAEYLISESYTGPVRHSLRYKHTKTFLVALALGTAISYSFLVGPASAGALVPDLAWWDMHHPYNSSLGKNLPSYISRDSTGLYPMELRGTDIAASCFGENQSDIGCPAEGSPMLNTWAWQRTREGSWYNISESQRYNPTMPSPFSGKAQREVVIESNALKNSTTSTDAAVSATLHSTILALTDAFWHYVNSNIVGKINKADRVKFTISKLVSIPLVQVQCQAYDFGIARSWSSQLTFETGAMINDFSKSGSNTYSWIQWIVPDYAWNVSRPQPWVDTTVTWVDTSEIKGTQGEPLDASLAAVVTVPVEFDVNFHNGSLLRQQGSITSPCIIDVRWATTNVTFDTTENIVRTGLTDWLSTADTLSGKVDLVTGLSKYNISDPISISKDWANNLNSLDNTTMANITNQNDFLIERLLYWFISVSGDVHSFYPVASNGQYPLLKAANDIAVVLSAVIVDWVSRSTFTDTSLTTVLSDPKDGNVSTINLLSQRTARNFGTAPVSTFVNQTEVQYMVQRYGWGYGLRTETIWFSIITLLIHVVLVIVYTVYSFVFWWRSKGWTSNAWGTVGELVALAVLSPPAAELSNTGAGINRSRTWMTPLRIREKKKDFKETTDSEKTDSERLELVVGNRGGTIKPNDNLVSLDKKYS